MAPIIRDHGGGLDKAMQQFGGQRHNWLDLSTGINPNPYHVPDIPNHFWHVLPDAQSQADLLTAARSFWNIPDEAEIIPASGVSAIIALLPSLGDFSQVSIINPTYNEFSASFTGHDYTLKNTAPVQVRVHPNNPDGRVFTRTEIEAQHNQLTIIDESFCDTCPEKSLIDIAAKPDHIILKGTGKFWGLAGLRLGFAIALPELADKISQRLGPWSISGPAQFIGQNALSNLQWAKDTRTQLAHMANKLDTILIQNELSVIGGTTLFRLAHTHDAKSLHKHLCQHHILTRIFPYSDNWVRFGLPANDTDLTRLNDALGLY